MSVGTRYGVVAGCAVLPLVFWVLYRYQSHDLPQLSPWLWIAAPVVAWVAAECAGRVWTRARWLGQALLLAGLGAGGVWWWWLNGLLLWGGASTVERLGVATGITVAYLATAMVNARLLGHTSGSREAEEAEPVSH